MDAASKLRALVPTYRTQDLENGPLFRSVRDSLWEEVTLAWHHAAQARARAHALREHARSLRTELHILWENTKLKG
jgi:hypothetical protein